MVIRLRRGAWIFLLLVTWLVLAPLFSIFSKAVALSEQGDTIIFSYNQTTIHQETAVNTSGKTELIATVRAAEFGYGTDTVLVGIALYGPGGGGIYFHDTGWVSLPSGGYTNVSLSINAESVGPGWSEISSIRLTVGGKDGEFWAGNYGPSIESASLKLDGEELLQNAEFSKGTQDWTSSVGWQTCHGTQGDKPCSTLASRTGNANYTLSENMVWAEADEGWNLSVSAPDGGTFTRVVFSSYGNPSGTTGQYSQGWCHAENSILKVSQALVGNSSGTIGASNGLFGDPCGGTYKRLYVVLEYTGGSPTTTTSTTTTSTTTTSTTSTTTTSTTSTTTTVPETTVPETTVPETTVAATTTTIASTTTLSPPPLTTISSTTTTKPPTITSTTSPEVPVEQTPPTTLPEPAPDQEAQEEAVQLEEALGQITNGALTAQVVNEVVDAILSGNVSQEEIQEAVTALVEADAISEEVAVELATSPEVLQSLDSEQAAEVFAAVEVDNLSDEQAKEIVAAVQNASEEVREAFEEEINVFDGAFDEYVPTGSAVSVGVRRAIVAATTVLSITGVATGTSPQASSRRIK